MLNKENIIALPMTQKEVIDLVAKGTRKGIWQAAGRTCVGLVVGCGVALGIMKLVDMKDQKTTEEDDFEDDADDDFDVENPIPDED